MDLNRVFGTGLEPGASPAAAGGSDGRAKSAPTLMPPQAFQAAATAAVALQREAAEYDAAVRRMASLVATLQAAADEVQANMDAVAGETAAFDRLAEAAELRLNEVSRIVQRYTVVQDPVVASDGFTYERRVIKQYLDDCQRSGATPVSQQTQQELTNVLVPNQSLRKLVDLLKIARAPVPTAAAAATAVPSPTAGASAGGATYAGVASGQHHGGSAAGAPATGSSHEGGPYRPDGAAPGSRAVGGPTGGASASSGGSGARLHPCVRVYGYCNYKESCTYASYPYDACLSHLKGKCRFGQQCHEMHVEFKGPSGGGAAASAYRRKE